MPENNTNLLDQLSDAQWALRESVNKIEQIVSSCRPGARLLQESERERLRHQERANKQAEALHFLLLASDAVVDRWDSPVWKDVPATREFIARLRHAIQNAKS